MSSAAAPAMPSTVRRELHDPEWWLLQEAEAAPNTSPSIGVTAPASVDALNEAIAWTRDMASLFARQTSVLVDLRTIAHRPTAVMPSAGDAVAIIRARLRLNMTEVARALGVERPTVYAWLDGRTEPNASNVRRLGNLVAAANRWGSAMDRLTPTQVRMPSMDGRSLVDLLAEDPIPEATLRERVAALPRANDASRGAARSAAVRQAAERHGIGLPTEEDRQTKIGLLTGRRLSADE